MVDFTRTTHSVRITNLTGTPADVPGATADFFMDIEILDAFSLILPNGFEIAYNVAAANAVPAIIDDTGDNNGIEVTDQSTRASHMTRLTGIADTTQFFDAEVCDAFTLIGPNNTDHVIACPVGKAVSAIVDDTGSGLEVAATENSTRAQHVVKILDQGSVTPGVDPPSGTPFVLSLMTDAIAFNGPPFGLPYSLTPDYGGPADVAFAEESVPPWGEHFVLQIPNKETLLQGALTPDATTNDLTQYVTDPDTGEQVPPPNTDPHVYVYFPDGSGGPFLGDGQGVDMGPLWWIRKAGSLNNDLMVMSFESSGTDTAWAAGCTLTTPDGNTYSIFSDINSIGTGNSAILDALPSSIFTADSTYTYNWTVSPSSGAPFQNFASFQTIFIKLSGFPADANGRKVFTVHTPAVTTTTNIKYGYVVFSDLFSAGVPTDYTITDFNGVSVYDYDTYVAARGGSYHFPDGEAFTDLASATSFANTNFGPPSGGGYVIYSDVPLSSNTSQNGGLSMFSATYNKKSTGGPVGGYPQPPGTPTIPADTTHPYQFPIHVPQYTLDIDMQPNGVDHPEYWDFESNCVSVGTPLCMWEIGYTNTPDDWPTNQWLGLFTSLPLTTTGSGPSYSAVAQDAYLGVQALTASEQAQNAIVPGYFPANILHWWAATAPSGPP